MPRGLLLFNVAANRSVRKIFRVHVHTHAIIEQLGSLFVRERRRARDGRRQRGERNSHRPIDARRARMNVSRQRRKARKRDRVRKLLAAGVHTLEYSGSSRTVDRHLLGVNKGFRPGQKGFWNLTADADYRGRTTRGYARDPLVSPVFVANNRGSAGTVGVVLGRSGPNHGTLDLSNTTGYNRMNYDLANTLSASLGSESPTVFANAGGFQFLQNVTSATANRFFDKVLAGTNVAFGGEFRADRYEIMRGDEHAEAEYDNNSLAQQGAQGFSGFGQASAVVGSRTNVGAFLTWKPT